MEGWKAAVRQYEHVQKRVDADTSIDRQHDICRNWLDKHVIPAIDEYWERSVFRAQAASTIRAFTQVNGSPERELVSSLEATICSFAKSLLSLADRRLVSRRLRESDRPTSIPVGAVWIGNDSEQVAIAPIHSHEVSDLELEWNQVRTLADSPQPLVNVEDFFEPVQEFVDVDRERIQRGELIVSVNDALLPIGDFIVWSLIRRAELRARLLKSFDNRMMHAVSATVHPYTNLLAEVTASRKDLKAGLSQLRPMFQLGEANRLRNACVVLTQVYATFQPAVDCGWLGLENETVVNGRAALRHRLRSYRSLEAFDQIAKSLAELRNLYEETPIDSCLDEAIGAEKLVIKTESEDFGRVWWEGEEVTKQFPKDGFKALLLLARRARRRQAVTEDDVYGETQETTSRFAMMISRLRKALPRSLRLLIKAGKPKRSYLMELDADRIHIA